MFQVFLTTFVSFFITLLAMPVILKEAERKKLYDSAEEKKLHGRRVASLGGLGILAGFLLASIMAIKGYLNPEFQYIYAAILLVFFLGLKNDLIELSVSKKLLGQFIAAAILVHLGGVHITNMHGLFGLWYIHPGVSFALSYLTIIVIINSFNLIDRVDGLAASLGILTMIVFGIYFFAVGKLAYALLAGGLGGSLVAFLIFNRPPAKIFMGNAGSFMLGLVNAVLVITFIKVANSPGVKIPVPSAVAIGIAILGVPLLDTLRVYSIRIFYGRSPFTSDGNHLHHLLLSIGFGHVSVTLTCVLLNIGFILLGWFGRDWGTNKLLIIMFALATCGIAILYYVKSRYMSRAEVLAVKEAEA